MIDMDVVRELLSSKKFVAMLVGLIVAAGGRLGLELSIEDVALFVAPIVAFILSQGVADLGKAAAKIAAARPAAGQLGATGATGATDGSEAETGPFPRVDRGP